VNITANIGWNSLSQMIKMLVQVVSLLYLAKMVHPDQYGLMAIAATFMNFGILLRDLGTASAIIQKKDLDGEITNAIFWINILMGGGLCILLIVIAPVVAQFYNQPKLLWILILLSFNFPLSSCSSAHLALMERESLFRKIAKIEITSSVSALFGALMAANLGWGVFALVLQALMLSSVSSVQIWTHSRWRPFSVLDTNFSSAKSIFGFSANLSAFNFVNYFSRNADSLIVGKFMGASVLGCYNLAYRVMLFPVQSLTYVTSRSIFPILSKYQDDNEKIKHCYFDCVFLILIISAPLMSTIAVLSDDFVNFFWGARWALTAKILAWLAPTAIIQSINSTSGSIFSAKGKTGVMFALGCVSAILQVGAFVVGAQYSIILLAELYFFSNFLNFVVTMEFMLRLVDSNLFELFRKIAPIIFSCLASDLLLVCMKIYCNISSIGNLFFFPLFSFGMYFFSLYVMSEKFRSIAKKGFRKLNFCI
jgi:O-antigen/teichoic acid export membrane protein